MSSSTGSAEPFLSSAHGSAGLLSSTPYRSLKYFSTVVVRPSCEKVRSRADLAENLPDSLYVNLEWDDLTWASRRQRLHRGRSTVSVNLMFGTNQRTEPATVGVHPEAQTCVVSCSCPAT